MKKEYKIWESLDAKAVEKTIPIMETDGWRLHSWQVAGGDGARSHYLLLEREVKER